MTCAYCGAVKLWDRTNFPDPIVAECSVCIARHAEPKDRRRVWPRLRKALRF